jgi:glycogen debranching enzyme
MKVLNHSEVIEIVPVTIQLRELGLSTIRELEAEKGILASSKEEIYGCIFGRDSLISALKLLEAYQRVPDESFLLLVKKILVNLSGLQGKEYNVESGEQPGKIIHEYRENNHEHLTKRGARPWYLYPDNTMKNYDSVDATLLYLVALSKFIEITKDQVFFENMVPHAMSAIGWLKSNIASHEYGFVSYEFPEDRKCGGLLTQSWMDSHDSIFHQDGSKVTYPISPVEAQGYAYAALRRWSRHLEDRDISESLALSRLADNLKRNFNTHFVQCRGEFNIAFALDGEMRAMTDLRSSPGHLLWLTGANASRSDGDSVLESIYIPQLVMLLMSQKIFEPEGGMRTLSKESRHYDPKSYHNGSIWPHDNAIIAHGFMSFGYEREAQMLQSALIRAWSHFNTPVELYVYEHGEFSEYVSSCGQKACAKQAWSAASMLSII